MKNILFVILTLCALVARAADYTFSNGYGVTFAWADANKIGIFTGTSVERDFRLYAIIGSHDASFTGTGFSLNTNQQYHSIYPYNIKYQVNENKATNLPLSFIGQTQSANASLAHLSKYDYMHSSLLVTEANYNFNFKHYCAVLRVKCRMNADATLNEMVLESTNGNFVTAATANIVAGTMTTTSTSPSMTVKLSDIEVSAGEDLVVYLMAAPTDLSKANLHVAFKTTNGETIQAAPIVGPDIKEGKVYCIDTSVSAKRTSVSATSAPRRASYISTPTAQATDFLIDKSYVPYTLGDANGDGRVTISDYSAIANRLQNATPSRFIAPAADIDEDGEITKADLTALVDILLLREGADEVAKAK